MSRKARRETRQVPMLPFPEHHLRIGPPKLLTRILPEFSRLLA